jgi:hypothetical protein
MTLEPASSETEVGKGTELVPNAARNNGECFIV